MKVLSIDRAKGLLDPLFFFDLPSGIFFFSLYCHDKNRILEFLEMKVRADRKHDCSDKTCQCT